MSGAEAGLSLDDALSSVVDPPVGDMLRHFLDDHGSHRAREVTACYKRLTSLLNPDMGYTDGSATSGGASLGRKSKDSYLHLAIDCPGYGRTKGDCQTIRSYPAELLSEVVKALGKKHAYALIGSSQGACAVFNAAIANPGICRFIPVRDPVGHDTSRYTAIRQPCHLIFDVDDPGHPVKVGRLMHRYLPFTYYHEHSSQIDPYYHEEHMATQILNMFAEHPHVDQGDSKSRPYLPRLAGGFRGWHMAHDREYKEWEDMPEATAELDSKVHDPDGFSSALQEDLIRVASDHSSSDSLSRTNSRTNSQPSA